MEWHHLELDINNSHFVARIDGIQVASIEGNFKFDSVALAVNGNNSDAGATFYYDDFTFTPEVECSTELSQAVYMNDDWVIATELRIAHHGSRPLIAEFKLWIDTPSGPVSSVNEGADGSVVLPVGFDVNYAPVFLFQVSGLFIRGHHSLGCRIVDAVTGEPRGGTESFFEIQ